MKKNPTRSPLPKSLRRSFTRRNVLKSAAALGTGSLLGCSSNDGFISSEAELSGRKRVAVVGGGAGGVAAAYFLDSVFDVDLLESRSKIGGHCDSHRVEYQGSELAVDLGAQFFHPETHPIYVSLLEELGLYTPDQPDTDETLEASGSICIFPMQGWWPLPVFSSQHPYLTPFLAVDFAIYAQAARQAVLQNMSWERTVEDWIASLPVSQRFKDSLLYPWISAAIGTTLENAKRSSARSILQTFALAFPANIFESATTFNSKLGLQGNLQRLLDHSPNTQVHLDSPALDLSFEAGNWYIRTPAGVQGPYAAVVLNAPPHTTKGVLEPIAWAGEITSVLDKYEYFDTRMLIHTDAEYVHRDRNFWAVYNGGVDGDKCEGSVWYGGIHGPLPNGERLNVFKSWASNRRSDPSEILFERNFRHPLITPEVIRASRKMADFQGLNGLYFSGQYTTGMDLQESAVYSAMKVAERLAPESTALASLRARLEQRGRSNVSYDL